MKPRHPVTNEEASGYWEVTPGVREPRYATNSRPRAEMVRLMAANPQLVFLRVCEAADLLRVSGATVRKWLKSGQLPGSKMPGQKRAQFFICGADLVAFARGNPKVVPRTVRFGEAA